MAENTTANNPNVKNESKKKRSTLAEWKAEYKRLSWPSRAVVTKNTVTVVVTSLIIGAIVFCMDSVITGVQTAAMSLFGLI